MRARTGAVRRQARGRRALCRRPRPHDAARGAGAARGDPVLRHREHREAAADFRRRAGGAAARRSACRWCADLPAWGRISATITRSAMVARVKNVRTINEMSRGLGLAGQIARWAMGKPSILAVTPSLVHWFWKTERHAGQPDLQGVFSPASYKQGFVGLLDDYPGMTVRGVAAPAGELGLCARAVDRSVRGSDHPAELSRRSDGPARCWSRACSWHAGCCTRRRWRRISTATRCPGPRCETDDELLDYARQYGSTAYHLIGTARMGPATDRTSVVDDQLRVHGLAGLRVVDASIMPQHAVGEHLCLDDDDRGEGIGHDPRPAAAAAGGGRSRLNVLPPPLRKAAFRCPAPLADRPRTPDYPTRMRKGARRGRFQEHGTLHRLTRPGSRGERRGDAAASAADQGRARHRQDGAGVRGGPRARPST